MAKKIRTISEQLRKFIADAPMSRYAICRQIGMFESNLSRFMANKGSLSLERVDAIAAVLGLELRAKER